MAPGAAAVVTGASGGIGKAVTTSLSARGFGVCAAGRDIERLKALEGEVGQVSRAGPLILHASDLSHDAGIHSLVECATSLLGRVDILVHAAGEIVLGDVETAGWSDLDVQYRVNVRAPFLLTKALLPWLKASCGQVVFINSTAGLRAGAQNILYAATKRAMHSLADSIRDHVSSDGVRVLSVFPGRTATGMQEAVHAFEGTHYSPERLLQVADVADLVMHALDMPRHVEVTDLTVRPARKSV